MKKTNQLIPLFLSFLFLMLNQNAQAQLWKKIKTEVTNRAEINVVNKAGNSTDKAVDKTADAIASTGSANQSVAGNSDTVKTADVNMPKGNNSNVPAKNYKNYDFVPGDKIIFEPDMSNEADAELPERFTIEYGVAEIQSDNGEKVLHLDKGSKTVVSPLMTSNNYLPEQFTVEFDMNMDDYYKHPDAIAVQFRTSGDNNYSMSPLCEFAVLWNSSCILGNYAKASEIDFPKELEVSMKQPNIWHHVAIYVHKNIGKAYIDGYRVYATNALPKGIERLDVRGNANYGYKIKNFRIAEGGDDKYNKIVTDGKFISHGILFDVNKSSIKPESAGALNEIVKLMNEHKDLNFEIDGYTDSDGNDDANMKLSQARADAVKVKLVDMGIKDSRLTTKGFGETKPIDKNDSSEGKANNRRVEFVKI